MPLIEWSESLSVKSRLLDADHKRLIDVINKLYDASQKGSNHAGVETAMEQLLSLTKTHFIHEETLMRKSAYPQFIPHKIEHDRLIKQLEDFQKRYAAGQVGLSNESVAFLRTWLCEHITSVDVSLGEWLSKHASLDTT
ncbi:MAG: bacteriohemerythrin [Alphaproteobacteria bacterium]|nr:bacteriohemerythrin [Alphaproteobacteria bacterium]